MPDAIARYAIPIVVIGLVLVFRMRRMGQQRPLNLSRMWIGPALIALMAGFVLWQAPPKPGDALWLAAAAIAGAGVGWMRGRTMKIVVDPATLTVNQQASRWALLFILGLVAVRYALRAVLITEHINLTLITDAFLIFAAATVIATRAEMFVRARRLIRECPKIPNL